MSDIDEYAKDCHQLIVVEMQTPMQCQSTVELLCSRVVQLLSRVAALESDKAQSVALRDPRSGGEAISKHMTVRVYDTPRKAGS